MTRVSIDIFSKKVFERIQSNNYIYSSLSTKLFLVWYSKFIIFCNYTLRFDEDTKLKYSIIFEKSPFDASFFGIIFIFYI